EPEAGDEANGGRAGGGAWAGGSEPEALPAMSGVVGAFPWMGAVSRVAAGTRSVVAWKSERAIPVIGTAAFFHTVWTRSGRVTSVVSPGTGQASAPAGRVQTTVAGTMRDALRSVSGPRSSTTAGIVVSN